MVVGSMGLDIDSKRCVDEALVLCALTLKPPQDEWVDVERYLGQGPIRQP